MDVTTGEHVDGPIDRCRYSEVAWLPGGKAFYYVRRLPPEAVPTGEDQYHRRVYLHRSARPADEDALVFGEGRDKTDYYGVSVSRDGRWLVISAAQGTAPRNDLWLADLSASGPARPRCAWSRRAWTRGPASMSAGTAGCTCSPTSARRGAGSRWPTPADPTAGLARPDRRGPEAVLRLRHPRRRGAGPPVLLAAWTRHARQRDHRARPGHRRAARRGAAARRSAPSAGSAERPEGGHEAWFGYTDYTTPVDI